MVITITEQAIKWYKEEMELKNGDYIRFYTKFYGSSPVQETYSLGFTKEVPIDIIASTVHDGITFFVEESDLWFFDGHDLQVHYNEKNDEIEYQYSKANE